MSQSAIEILRESQQTLNSFLSGRQNIDSIEAAAEIMYQCLQAGGTILSCGNGGSMCDAMHFAEELSGKFRHDRKALAAMAISDPSFLTCTANDYGFDFVFSRFVEAHGKLGDILLAISTSGNSPNVIQAANSARSKGMKVIALTGKNGGQLADLADVEIRAPYSEYADRAQEIHIKVIHCLIQLIESKMS